MTDESKNNGGGAPHENKDAELALLRQLVATLSMGIIGSVSGNPMLKAMAGVQVRVLLEQYANEFAEPRLKARGEDTSPEALRELLSESGLNLDGPAEPVRRRDPDPSLN